MDISTHAPRTGGDLCGAEPLHRPDDFNPRPPHRGRLFSECGLGAPQQISTHAPRTGGDHTVFLVLEQGEHFNPRPPHRGRQQKQPKQNPRFPLNPAPPPNPHPPKHHPQDLPPRTPPISPGKPGAKPLRSPVRFPFAPTISEHPPGRKSPWRRNARSCFRTGSPGNKSAGCLFPGP